MEKFAEKEQLIIAYSYDSDCKRLIGSFEYLWAEGTGLAANSTDIQPPTFKNGKIPTFDEDAQKWNLVDDNRRKTVYSTVNQSKSTIDYVGKIKDGFTLLEPTSTYDTWTGKAWADQRTDEEKEAERLKQFTTLNRLQFKLVLHENDLLQSIEDAIESIEDPKMKMKIQIQYSEADKFERTSESVQYMLQLMNLTSDEADKLWLQAMTF